MTAWETWAKAEAGRLKDENLWRTLLHPENDDGRHLVLDGRKILNACSNDYLGLRGAPALRIALAEAVNSDLPLGSGASRYVTGSHPLHFQAEERLAALKGLPAARLFSSGYLANLGAVSALLGRGDHLLSDERNHASLIDAARLSRAEIHVFRHNDVDHVSEILKGLPGPGRRLIAVESVYSMDGDLAPLKHLASAAGESGALLLVDEAHGTGVFGPGGSGAAREVHGLCDLAVIGTLSKSLGLIGGFIAGDRWLVDIVTQKARTAIFDTALPVILMPPLLAALDWLAGHPEAGAGLLSRAGRLRARLQSSGVNTGASASQIIPLMAGGEDRALQLAQQLLDAGLMVRAIRYPTVPRNQARLRMTLSLAQTQDDVETIERAVNQVWNG